MIIALLFFALTSAFAAAAIVSLMGFSFWIALAAYPLVGTLALLVGAILVAAHKTTQIQPVEEYREPAHA
ncbi:hypothetical protein [Pacificibacter sp. AS14]|uniref:hypothetical protein n=1 Tax=Pacificibacter sp. AS14 TaxID=3135785 RepID=UPI0031761579